MARIPALTAAGKWCQAATTWARSGGISGVFCDLFSARCNCAESPCSPSRISLRFRHLRVFGTAFVKRGFGVRIPEVAPLSGSDTSCQVATRAPLTTPPAPALPNTRSWRGMTDNDVPGRRRAAIALKEPGPGLRNRAQTADVSRPLKSHSWEKGLEDQRQMRHNRMCSRPNTASGSILQKQRRGGTAERRLFMLGHPMETSPTGRLALLVDHDNIRRNSLSIKTLLPTWFGGIQEALPETGVLAVDVRAYGGWYSEDQVTPARFEAAEFYQRDCPSLVRFREAYFTVRFEFADSLLYKGPPPCAAESAIRVTHSVVERASPQYVRLNDSRPTCLESDCRLNEVRHWIKHKRACLNPECPLSFEDCFVRREQKQVDVHLAVDLIACANPLSGYGHVAVASDDADFLPAIAYASQIGAADGTVCLLRSPSGGTTYMDTLLVEHDVRLIAMPGEEGG